VSHDRSDLRDDLRVGNSNPLLGLAPCYLQSHEHCRREDCEVRQSADLYEQLTSGAVTVGIVTAITGLVVSGLVGIGVFLVWLVHALQGTPMPDIPVIIGTIAGAPFVAGAITAVKIPKRARVKLEQK
jgi:hypothetical protein